MTTGKLHALVFFVIYWIFTNRKSYDAKIMLLKVSIFFQKTFSSLATHAYAIFVTLLNYEIVHR